MKLSRLLLLLSLFGGISFGQVYQGPAAGSVASGTTVSTETKMNDLGGVHFKTHPPKNIFTNMLL
ncbi:MAG: hypothetical protein J5I57_12005, partial [Melioribacteraceae bacterium]|nr:hypothetical protein [Melioribacteraceae bacterium]